MAVCREFRRATQRCVLCALARVLAASIGCTSPDALANPSYHPDAADLHRIAATPPVESPAAFEPAAAEDQSDVPLQQRVVIYTAGFRIVVQRIEESLDATQRIAAETGGYVQELRGDQITIRVPAEKYDGAIERLTALGQVVDRQLQAQDVTEDYVDLAARLNNARNVRTRFEALLAQTNTVEAALAAEKELGRVSEEIERLEAKLAVLRNRVAYSTLTVKFERVARQTELIRGLGELPFAWLRELDPNRLWLTY